VKVMMMIPGLTICSINGLNERYRWDKVLASTSLLLISKFWNRCLVFNFRLSNCMLFFSMYAGASQS
jgi:hypothetical protein